MQANGKTVQQGVNVLLRCLRITGMIPMWDECFVAWYLIIYIASINHQQVNNVFFPGANQGARLAIGFELFK